MSHDLTLETVHTPRTSPQSSPNRSSPRSARCARAGRPRPAPGPGAPPGSCPSRAPAPPPAAAPWKPAACLGESIRSLGSQPPGPRAEAAWEWFLGRYRSWIRRRCVAHLHHSKLPICDDEVDDLLQEVLYRLLENGGRRLRCFRGRTEASWRAYLDRVARTVALRWVRKIASLKRGGPGVSTGGRRLRRAHRRSARWLVAGEPSPERRAEDRQECARLIRGCRRVAGPRQPERDFTILRLAFVQGWTSGEIGALLGLSASAVDSVISRARRQLLQEGLEPPDRTPQGLAGESWRPPLAERSAMIPPCSPS